MVKQTKKQRVSDALWGAIAPLIPPEPPKPKGGRPPIPARAALTGIVFVLKSGIDWNLLPAEMGCGSGTTCWRRLRDWQAAAGAPWADGSSCTECCSTVLGTPSGLTGRGSVWIAAVCGQKGGDATGRNPADRGKAGTKRGRPLGSIAVDAQGVPLAVMRSGANQHDGPFVLPLVDAIPAITGRRGRPRKRPDKLHADKAYDFGVYRRALRARHITPRIARRGIESKERLGRYRWVIERNFAGLGQFRRLAIRYERKAAHYLAFLHLANALTCLRFLQRE